MYIYNILWVCIYTYIYIYIFIPFIVIKSCPTFCDAMDYSLPGFSVHGISMQEYWSELPFPSPGYLPNPGMEPRSPALQAGSLPLATPEV